MSSANFALSACCKVGKKRRDFGSLVCYDDTAENEHGRKWWQQVEENIITQRAVLEELAAIGFANASDYLFVEDGVLTIRPTRQLPPGAGAAIASIERTSGGLKLKLYDKLRALELLGKHVGLFDGSGSDQPQQNNLLDALLEATREEVDTRDIPEIQQTPEFGDDLVEQTLSSPL